jgi:hypothetical protein
MTMAYTLMCVWYCRRENWFIRHEKYDHRISLQTRIMVLCLRDSKLFWIFTKKEKLRNGNNFITPVTFKIF